MPNLTIRFPHYSKVTFLFGSHVYGTNTPESDYDYKTIYIPRGDSILSQRVEDAFRQDTKENERAKNKKGDVDHSVYSLQKYINLLLEGQTEALEILFTPDRFICGETPWWWNKIRNSGQNFLHKGTSQFAHYCQDQANKYGIKGSRVAAFRAVKDELDARKGSYFDDNGGLRIEELDSIWRTLSESSPFIKVTDIEQKSGQLARHLEVAGKKIPYNSTVKHALPLVQKWFDEYGERALQAEKNEGIDWKALMHAVRVARQAKELLLTGQITLPRPDAEELKRIRLGYDKGGPSYQEVAAMIEEGLLELESARLRSTLPETPDREWAEYKVQRRYFEACQSYLGELVGAPKE